MALCRFRTEVPLLLAGGTDGRIKHEVKLDRVVHFIASVRVDDLVFPY